MRLKIYTFFLAFLPFVLSAQRDSIVDFINNSEVDSAISKAEVLLGKTYIGENDSLSVYHFKKGLRHAQVARHVPLIAHSSFFVAFHYADKSLDSCRYYSEIAEQNLVREKDSIWRMHLYKNWAIAVLMRPTTKVLFNIISGP